MGWEQRGNQLYYYRKRREGGRVVSEYVGSGLLGQYSEFIDEMEQEQRRAARAAQKSDREICRRLDDFGHQVRKVHDYVMLVSGYHTSNREWRKMAAIRPDMVSKADAQKLDELDFMDVLETVDSDSPSTSDTRALQRMIDDVPALVNELIGIAAVVRTNLVQTMTPNRSVEVATQAEIAGKRVRLGYDQADGLEQLLIENIIMSWLRLQQVEDHLTNCSANSKEYFDGRLNAAQRRFLRACTTLARVRKMGAERVVINNRAETINNQVNA